MFGHNCGLFIGIFCFFGLCEIRPSEPPIKLSTYFPVVPVEAACLATTVDFLSAFFAFSDFAKFGHRNLPSNYPHISQSFPMKRHVWPQLWLTVPIYYDAKAQPRERAW